MFFIAPFLTVKVAHCKPCIISTKLSVVVHHNIWWWTCWGRQCLCWCQGWRVIYGSCYHTSFNKGRLHCDQAILYHISSKKLRPNLKFLPFFKIFAHWRGYLFKGCLICGELEGRLDWICLGWGQYHPGFSIVYITP